MFTSKYRNLFLTAFCIFSSPAFAKDYTVKIITDYDNMRMAFDPQTIIIKTGDKVTWINTKSETHNIITYPDGYPEGASSFNSPYLEKEGQTWSHVFDKAGTYEYHCIPHLMMGMRGKIIVDTPTEQGKWHNPTNQERRDYQKKLLEYYDEDTIKSLQTSVSKTTN